MEGKNSKNERILGIYTKLINGTLITKAKEAKLYGVNERSIQRDIDDIRNFLALNIEESGQAKSIIYDRRNRGYRLSQAPHYRLTNSEVLALCKILLGSRAFTKAEMEKILKKLIFCCVPLDNQKLVHGLISNEMFHYIEPRHKKEFLNILWDIGRAVKECRYLEIDYFRTKDKSVVNRTVKPVAIMFSEYYFYLTAFIEDSEVRKDFDVINDSSPTIYRIDRIRKLTISKERFHIPYHSRFEEGEFRKRIQFMYGGKLRKVKFKYKGTDIDAVLDRLPTAQIIAEKDGIYIVTAEVFGSGIDMWMRSQGEFVESIS